jgi:Putative MetA-pathway of phenol degradation
MISGAVKRSKLVRLECLGASVFVGLLYRSLSPAFADGCPKSTNEIETDRPDITNSSRVVPQGSLQFENGINFMTPESSRVLDGSNTRTRLGIAPCLEVLADVPSYIATLSGPVASGFTDVAPAVKWQVSPMPGKFDLSAVAGIGLPTGSKALVGPGPQPYVQFP